jgi:moderate conductance mechanosensitive channel
MRVKRLCLRAVLLAMLLLTPALGWALDAPDGSHAVPSQTAPAPPPVSPPAATAPAAPPPAAVSAPTLELSPNSLGAALLVWAESGLGGLSDAAVHSLQAVNVFPSIGRWLSRLATDPAMRGNLLSAAWRTALIVAIGLSLEHLLSRALRRPLLALRRRAPAAPGDELPEEVHGLAEAERGNIEPIGRHEALLLALRRLPYVAAAFLLDLLPVLMVPATAAAYALGLSGTLTSRLVIITCVNGYVIWRFVVALARMVVSPRSGRLRLAPLDALAARHVLHDVAQIAAIAIGGYAIIEDALLFGLARSAHEVLLKLIVLAVYLLFARLVLRLQRRVKQALRAPEGAKGLLAVLRNALAGGWHRIVLFYFAALWLIWVLDIANGSDRLLIFTVEVMLLGVGLRLVNVLMRNSFERLLAASEGMDESYPGIQRRLSSYHSMARAAVNVALTAIFVVGVFWSAGVDVFAWFGPHTLGAQVMDAFGNILTALAIALVVWELANIGVERHLAALNRSSQLSRSARLRTLLPMLRTTLLAVVLVVCALVVLSEIGVNIAPLLAGAGVLGLAIGFGSQKLVQDIITGLFLLLENTMQVGDVVTLAGLTGTVENLSIRTIRLRSLDGSVHIVPFSAVTSVTNMTRDYSYAVADVSLHVNEEPDRVGGILQEIAAEMRGEQPWRGMILADLEVMGVERFIDLGYILRARMKTLPASRWAVGRELNRRIKQRFDALAINSPITSQVALGVTGIAQSTIIGTTEIRIVK